MESEEIRPAKKELRRTIRRRLDEFPFEEQERESQAVSATFVRRPEWSESSDVLLFLSMTGEIDTRGLLQAAIDAGKRVWAPRMHGREMEFHLIWDGERSGTSEGPGTPDDQSTAGPARVPPLSFLDLTYNPYGIWEPLKSSPVFTGAADAGKAGPRGGCIMAAPGLAFDRSGGRLGRGKAYYDKWLSRHAELLETGRLVAIGIGFSIQLVDEVPCAANDKKLPQLIIGGAHISCSHSGQAG